LCSLLGRYVLNKHSLSREEALHRLEAVMQVAQGYKPRGDNSVAFAEHLNDNLSDYNWGRCPLTGCCLPDRFNSILEGYPIEGYPDHVIKKTFQSGFHMMRYLQCDHQISIPLGSVLVPDVLLCGRNIPE